MSLRPGANEERVWGEFPNLRSISKQAKVADHHYGLSTASDNVFDRVRHLLEVALIVDDNKEAVTAALKGHDPSGLAKDLARLQEAMKWAKSNCFGRAAEEIDEILAHS